ncbi:MAG: EamA family transporter [Firmicutes bacterium]|nr:EamA family transporter [Bacillota bacterium]
MWNLLWPMLLVVGSNCLYHICAKSLPSGLNPFCSLTVTYLVGAVLSALFFLISPGRDAVGAELARVNWTGLALGLAIVGLEAGNVFMYRAGWKVSSGALVASVGLACALLLIGWLLYRETITPRQLLGVAVCGLGLLLVTYQ